MKVLISGFKPFDGMNYNPSEDVVRALTKEKFSFELHGLILPVSFNQSFLKLEEKIDELRPDVVISFGLADIRDEITPERIAINYVDARIPDNDGEQPRNQKISPDAPDGIFSTLPLDNIMNALSEDNIKSSISNTAGTYVCNFLMFKLLEKAKKEAFQAGFIHLPATQVKNANSPQMPWEEVLKGCHVILSSL